MLTVCVEYVGLCLRLACAYPTDPPGQAPSSASFAVEELGLYEGFKVMLRVKAEA